MEPHLRSFTIKGIPDDLYRLLRRQAAEHRRSINAEILVCLERALASRPVDVDAVLARADAVRERASGPPITASAIRRARSRGRS